MDNTKKPEGQLSDKKPDTNPRSSEDYKNPETRVNNPEYFNDDFEVEEENKLSRDNAKGEDYGKEDKQ